MCTVNDNIRKEYTNKIEKLNIELESEIKKRSDINKAYIETQQLINNAQCVIDNISECNFSGDVILSSIKTSNQGYNERIDFYSKYYIECHKAVEQINKEINETTVFRDTLPENCGVCDDCIPSSNPNNSVEEE